MLTEEQLQRAEAHVGQIFDGFLPVIQISVFELAGMVRKTINTIRELQTRVAELEKELAFADSDVAAKRTYIDDLEREMACAKRLDTMQLEQIEKLKARVETTTWYNGQILTELGALRERVGKLEADAALGKELREMPGSHKLYRRESDHQRPWLCVPIWEDTSLYQMSEYFDTPEAALEAVRKEEP